MGKTGLWLIALAAIALVAGPAAAAGRSEQAPKAGARMKISWLGMNTRGELLQKNSPVEAYMEKRFDVDFEPWYDMDYYQTEQIRVRLASGDIPDFLYSQGNLSSLKDLGIIREVSQDALRKYMPKATATMQKLAPETLWSRTTIDGKNWGIPQALSISAAGPMIVTREDWMTAVGVTKKPETIAELENLYLRYRNNDPDGNGKKDTYALSIFKSQNETIIRESYFSQEFGAFGVTLNDWTKKGDRIEYSMTSAEFKEALKFLAEWYRKEIIDPEFLMDLRKETNAKFANGKLGAYEDFSSWTSEQPGGPVHSLKQLKPDIKYVYIISPKGPTGKRGTPNRDASSTPSVLGKQVSDDKMARILAIIDTLIMDPEVYATACYGIKDQHWKYTPQGFVEVLPPYNDAKEQSKIGVNYWRFQTVHDGNEKIYMPEYRYPAHRFAMENQTLLPLGFLPTLNTAMSTTAQNLARLESEFFLKGLTGALDIDKEWDGYLARWNAAGGDKLSAFVNDQYKASLKQ